VISLRDYIFSAVPGAFLLLALRNALTGSPWTWIALCLLAGLFSYWLELWQRRRQGQ
jgi:Flp pilus assembly protein TadB